jgi:hypothetical protein
MFACSALSRPHPAGGERPGELETAERVMLVIAVDSLGGA